MKLNIDLNAMFEIFHSIEEMFHSENRLIEISIKQDIIKLYFLEKDTFYFNDVLSLANDDLINIESTYLLFHNDVSIVVEDIPKDVDTSQSKFKDLINVIHYLADHICRCPSLEFTISSQYIKFYLDKPGIKTSEICKVEDLFNAECTLELHLDRPYALFINENL